MRLFHLPVRPARSRRSVLSLQCLEGREVPAGNVTAAISPLGMLTITGDDDANSITLTTTLTGITIAPNAGTTVNGSATTATLGAFKSIKADLKGGDDTVSIDTAAGFKVTGSTSITLGDGDNTLDMTTTGKIELAALTVKGGDGVDTVTIQGGATSVVTGAASFSYLSGGSTTTLDGIGFGSTLKVTATEGAGVITNNVLATNVNVAKTVTASLGSSNPSQVSFTNGTIGGLTASGQVIQAILETTTVNGSIALKGGFQADVQLVNGVTVTKNVTLTAPLPSIETAALSAGSTINGNLTLTGTGWTSVSIVGTTTVTEVKGNVTVTGGWFNDQFVTDSNFKVGKSLTLNLKGGDNSVAIGDGAAAVTIGGNLKIVGGAGNDSITLDRVTLTGAVPLMGSTTILTLGGADFLSIEDSSSFAKTFTADMGAGDDTISIAQNTGSLGGTPVTFTGNAKILGGIGNDSLFLGIEPLTGDANTKAVFSGTKNLVDGGVGIDFFDAASGQFTGVTPVNWT